MTLPRKTRTLLLVAAALASLGLGRCPLVASRLEFRSPAPLLLTAPGNLDFDLRVDVPFRGSVEVLFDGVPIPEALLTVVSDGVVGSVSPATEGTHELTAIFRPRSPLMRTLRSSVRVEVVDMPNADECEQLNAAECLLPYPSSRFLMEAPTATGYRLAIPQAGMPMANGPPISPDPINVFDGFSPTVQILMHFPAGVDLAASRAAVLHEARCCGQSAVAPYVNVRTHDARSLDASRRNGSPTVLIDADTGERVLHFVEHDAHAEGNPERQLLFMRPAVGLVPGHRYIVALRNLVDRNGQPVLPEPAFRALRDGTPSTLPALEARRGRFEDIFERLRRARVRRGDLVLAFDFVVRSDGELTREMLAMRDDAFAYFDSNPLEIDMDFGFNAANFHGDCAVTGNPVWRRVRGTFDSPFYLTPNPNGANPASDGYVGVQRLSADPSGTPLRNGVHQVPFDFFIPCSVLAAESRVPPIVIGHGLFGTGAGMIDSIEGLDTVIRDLGLGDFRYIAGATDWRGLSSKDLAFVGTQVIGIGSNQLNNFPSFTARLKQGMLDTLVLGHLMKTGAFNARGQFQRTPGMPSTGVFPGEEEEMYYYGISLGGIMGLFFGALTPDVERMQIDVGSINFSLLLQRSTQFTIFESLLEGIGLTDPIQTALGLSLLHETWVSSEPAGYARHITGLVDPPLPGSRAKKLLFTPAWLDKQVSNQAQEITARTLGLPNVEGSLVAGLVGIPDVAAGADSGLFVWDTGSFDVFDPAFDAVIPPLANRIPSPVCDPHARRLTIPAAFAQQLAFLQPGGGILNPCGDDGVCNGSEAFELPGNDLNVCDPLAP